MPEGREVLAARIAAVGEAKAQLDRARAQGVACTRCGGNVALPADLTIPQFPCRFCGTLLVTAQYVPADYLKGVGMREKLDAIRAEARTASKQRDKVILIGAAVLALVILVAVFVPLWLQHRP